MSDLSMTPYQEDVDPGSEGGSTSQFSRSPDQPWKLHRRRAWLRHLGALGPVDLYLGSDGLPCFEGMASEHGDFHIPPFTAPNTSLVATQDFNDFLPINTPAVLPGWLYIIVDILCDAYDSPVHVAWADAMRELDNIPSTPQDGEPSAFVVLEILCLAKKAYTDDHQHLEEFIGCASENKMLLMNQQRPVSGWVAQCMARMIGLEADQEDDREWWASSTIQGWVWYANYEAYVCIHHSWLEFNRGHDRCYQENDLYRGLQAAERGFGQMFGFFGLHKNEEMLVRVESQIQKLRDFIRSRGFGRYLPTCY